MKIRWMEFDADTENKEYKISESYSIDEACEYLERYLNDEMQLLNSSGYIGLIKRKKQKREKNEAGDAPAINMQELGEEQVLIICAAVIGNRVIRKYCIGERPHWQRAAFWRKSLRIMDYFEQTGILKTKGIRYYLKDGYLFLCRVYDDVDGIGMVILPETKPCKPSELFLFTDGGDDTPGPFYDMPSLLGSTCVIKKQEAARKIDEFVI